MKRKKSAEMESLGVRRVVIGNGQVTVGGKKIDDRLIRSIRSTIVIDFHGGSQITLYPSEPTTADLFVQESDATRMLNLAEFALAKPV